MKVRGPYLRILEGEHIYLREVRLSDVNETYYRWMNDPEITRNIESRFFPNSIETLKEFVGEIARNRECAFFAIILKDEKRHIGNIKIGPINFIHRFADVGILIGEKDCWGRGLGTETIRIISEYAFSKLNLNKLTAGCYDQNIGSIKAFKKAGFSEEGIRKQQYFCDGQYVDDVILGLLRADFKKLRTL